MQVGFTPATFGDLTPGTSGPHPLIPPATPLNKGVFIAAPDGLTIRLDAGEPIPRPVIPVGHAYALRDSDLPGGGPVALKVTDANDPQRSWAGVVGASTASADPLLAPPKQPRTVAATGPGGQVLTGAVAIDLARWVPFPIETGTYLVEALAGEHTSAPARMRVEIVHP